MSQDPTLPAVDPKLVPDPSKLNLYKLPDEESQNYINATKDALDKLEQRYAQPNWFKIAAGFAKPQLGGFLASLGSAAEAQGQTVEQQRAIAPTIAMMRANLGAQQAIMSQNKTQATDWQDFLTHPPGDPKEALRRATDIATRNPDSAVGKAASSWVTQNQTASTTTGQQQEQRLNAITASGKDPMAQFDPFIQSQLNPNSDPKELEAKQKQFLTSVEGAKPPQIDQSQWDSMERYEKMKMASDYAAKQLEAGMGVEEKMRQQANSAPERLSLLRNIRDLSLGVGVPDVVLPDGTKVTGQQQMAAGFNVFGGNNPVEVLARAAADGKLGEKLADLDKYARQANMSPQARDQFQKVNKLLAEWSVSMRGSSTNPTDALAYLQQQGSPSIGNSQKALVSLVDLLGHDEYTNLDKYKYAKEKKLPYGELEHNPQFLTMLTNKALDRNKIATQDPTVATPNWYNPNAIFENKPTAAVSGQAVQPTSAPNPAERPKTRVFKDVTYDLQPDNSYKKREVKP